VDYALTEFGKSLSGAFASLFEWVEAHQTEILEALLEAS
jgi:DNA-binding HxlR family transcriptional regulator